MGFEIGAMAALLGAAFVDLAPIVRCSPVDGVHYDAEGHAAIAVAIGMRSRR